MYVSSTAKGAVVACFVALLPLPATAEMDGACGPAVGTFLMTNKLVNNGNTGSSRSLLVLTNGGHVLRFDSDEMSAVIDSRPFGDSAGTWRCDGVDDNGTMRLTATMLDFTYPNAEGDKGQIARIDATGKVSPSGDTLELTGDLGFLPLEADAGSADALSKASGPIAITLSGKRIEVPSTP